MERETRFVPIEDAEVRADDEGGGKGLDGSFAVFDRGTVIAGLFEERIAPGAFDDAIKDSDVRGLFNHDANYVLGRTKSGTMALSADGKAARYRIPTLPRARADVLEAIERGDVTGNSFSFQIEKDSDQEWVDRSKEKKLPLRIIKRVGRLFDVGPVTFPAYEQTKVSARATERAQALAVQEMPPKMAPPPEDQSRGAPLNADAEREKLRLAEAENLTA